MIHYSLKCFLNNEKSSRMTFLTTSESHDGSDSAPSPSSVHLEALQQNSLLKSSHLLTLLIALLHTGKVHVQNMCELHHFLVPA